MAKRKETDSVKKEAAVARGLLGGRPKVDIDWKVFEAIVQFRVTKQFCADHLGVSTVTIDNKLMETYGQTFLQYKEAHSTKIILRLQSKAVEMALSGNTPMMIFILKNLAGFTDKPAELEELKSSFQNIEELLDEVARRRSKKDDY